MYSVGLDKKKNWFNRCAALVAIGSTKLDSMILKKLKSLYDRETNTDVKRAIALCLVQLDRTNLIAFVRKLRGELENHLTILGNYYEKVIFNRDNVAQKWVSTLKNIHPNADFFKEHFYTIYLLANVDKKSLKQDLAKLLKKHYNEIKEEKFREQIRYLYKEITNVEL